MSKSPDELSGKVSDVVFVHLYKVSTDRQVRIVEASWEGDLDFTGLFLVNYGQFRCLKFLPQPANTTKKYVTCYKCYDCRAFL